MGLTDEQRKVAEAIGALPLECSAMAKYRLIAAVAEIMCNVGDHADLFIRTAIDHQNKNV